MSARPSAHLQLAVLWELAGRWWVAVLWELACKPCLTLWELACKRWAVVCQPSIASRLAPTGGMHLGRLGEPSAQAKTDKPCLFTTSSNFNATPLGFLAPVSHFWIVDSLVLR